MLNRVRSALVEALDWTSRLTPRAQIEAAIVDVDLLLTEAVKQPNEVESAPSMRRSYAAEEALLRQVL